MSRRLLHRLLPTPRRPDRLEHHRDRVAGRMTAWVEQPPEPTSPEPPIVLVPGLSMSWRAYVWLLAEIPRDRRVLVVDPPGAGRSRSLRRRMDAAAQARHLAAWLDHLGLVQADVVGHSHGALSSARLAALRPEVVRLVVLVSPSPDPRWPHLVQHIGALLRGAPDEAPRVVLQAAWDYVRSSPRLLVGFRHDIGLRPADVMAGATAPVLVVRGSEDVVSSADWCRDLAAAAGGRVETVAGGAHGLPQQHPRELAALVAAHAVDDPAPS